MLTTIFMAYAIPTVLVATSSVAYFIWAELTAPRYS